MAEWVQKPPFPPLLYALGNLRNLVFLKEKNRSLSAKVTEHRSAEIYQNFLRYWNGTMPMPFDGFHSCS